MCIEIDDLTLPRDGIIVFLRAIDHRRKPIHKELR